MQVCQVTFSLTCERKPAGPFLVGQSQPRGKVRDVELVRKSPRVFQRRAKFPLHCDARPLGFEPDIGNIHLPVSHRGVKTTSVYCYWADTRRSNIKHRPDIHTGRIHAFALHRTGQIQVARHHSPSIRLRLISRRYAGNNFLQIKMIDHKFECVRKLVGKLDCGAPVCLARLRHYCPIDLTHLLFQSAMQPHIADVPRPNTQRLDLERGCPSQNGQVCPLPGHFQATLKYTRKCVVTEELCYIKTRESHCAGV